MIPPTVSVRPFGRLPDGREIRAYTCFLQGGLSLTAIDYGAIITSLMAPDRGGRYENVVIGFDSPEAYLGDRHYIGAAIGRVANRISHGRITLHGKACQLSVNHPPHHLHGGYRGFHNRHWNAEPVYTADTCGIRFSTVCLDGEEGYPANLQVSVTYLIRGLSLSVIWEAHADGDTVCNPTQHSYFNLDPQRGTILDHDLQIHADAMLETDARLIPTGNMLSVSGTALDYSTEKNLGEIRLPGRALDHSWVLTKPGLSHVAASLYAARNGRRLDVLTAAPTVHVYSGQGLQADYLTTNHQPVTPFAGICLETQGYADSPNHPEFPSIVLRAEASWRSETRFSFSVR